MCCSVLQCVAVSGRGQCHYIPCLCVVVCSSPVERLITCFHLFDQRKKRTTLLRLKILFVKQGASLFVDVMVIIMWHILLGFRTVCVCVCNRERARFIRFFLFQEDASPFLKGTILLNNTKLLILLEFEAVWYTTHTHTHATTYANTHANTHSHIETHTCPQEMSDTAGVRKCVLQCVAVRCSAL